LCRSVFCDNDGKIPFTFPWDTALLKGLGLYAAAFVLAVFAAFLYRTLKHAGLG
jgi:hypothetical protein